MSKEELKYTVKYFADLIGAFFEELIYLNRLDAL